MKHLYTQGYDGVSKRYLESRGFNLGADPSRTAGATEVLWNRLMIAPSQSARKMKSETFSHSRSAQPNTRLRSRSSPCHLLQWKLFGRSYAIRDLAGR